MAYIDYTEYKDLKIDLKFFDNETSSNTEIIGLILLSNYCKPITNLKKGSTLRSKKYSHILDSRFSWKISLPVKSVKLYKSVLIKAFLFGTDFQIKLYNGATISTYIPVEWERDSLDNSYINNLIDLENINLELLMKDGLI